jgi:hypothetical protein
MFVRKPCQIIYVGKEKETKQKLGNLTEVQSRKSIHNISIHRGQKEPEGSHTWNSLAPTLIRHAPGLECVFFSGKFLFLLQSYLISWTNLKNKYMKISLMFKQIG